MKQPRPLPEIQRDIDAVKQLLNGKLNNSLQIRLKNRELHILIQERQDAELWISKTISEL